MERLDLIDRNPAARIICPEYKAKETKHYDLDTYRMLLEKLEQTDDCIYTPVLIMGVLGLRPSEALALTDEDLQDCTLNVCKAAITVKRKNRKQAVYVGKTKTDKSARGFSLDSDFVEKILSYKKRHNIVSPYLCVQKNGALITTTVLKGHLAHAVKQFGLPSITPYGLRHTFGQIQKALGTDVYTISRLMGHSTTAVTTKTYFHNDKTLNKSAIQKLTDLV